MEPKLNPARHEAHAGGGGTIPSYQAPPTIPDTAETLEAAARKLITDMGDRAEAFGVELFGLMKPLADRILAAPVSDTLKVPIVQLLMDSVEAAMESMAAPLEKLS